MSALRVLFVAMSDSIHTARWIGQIADQGWDLHLFPSIDHGLAHPELRNVTIHHSFYGRAGKGGEASRSTGLYVRSGNVAYVGRMATKEFWPTYREWQLARLIDRLQPNLVQSMEFQAGGYLTLAARARVRKRFPKWIATNWGSDIYLFGRLDSHRKRIARVLGECDFYSCECRRDIGLAEKMGLAGEVLPLFPNTGGFDLRELEQLRTPGPASRRRMIMLKGYQHWAGRALVGIRALGRCADVLDGYTIVVYSAERDVALAAELLGVNTGIKTVILPRGVSHREILSYHGKARISVGLSISDAISTSFLEAMAMGSFPIQSFTSCANEWAEHGRDALLVPPEDPEEVEAALRLALTDDTLVDQAAARNWQTATERLDRTRIQPKVIEMYERIAASSHADRST